MVLHIKGLEATSYVDEVKSSIRVIKGLEEVEIRTGELRPAFGGTQNITVTVDRDSGRRLMESAPIQIGWAACTVKERVEVRRCHKCWGLGHMANKCDSSEDRRDLCLRCAQPGHLVKDCRNSPYCPLCAREGHRADTTTCPQFREAVDGKRDRSKGSILPRLTQSRVLQSQGVFTDGLPTTEQEAAHGIRSERTTNRAGESEIDVVVDGRGADQGGPSFTAQQ